MGDSKAENYIQTMWHLQEDSSDVVPPSEIAATLDVTTPTVTATMKTLHERGLVEREAYKGARLTKKGEAVALEIVRHHRLLELFLAEHLDYDWAAVHEEADRLDYHILSVVTMYHHIRLVPRRLRRAKRVGWLGGRVHRRNGERTYDRNYISEKLATELAAVLDDPAVDPHGAPIPTADLDLPDVDDSPLSHCQEGDVVSVVQVPDRDPALLDYLTDVGITPGSQIEIRDVAPFNMITVIVNTSAVSLSEDVAALIHVRETDSFQSDNGMVVAG